MIRMSRCVIAPALALSVALAGCSNKAPDTAASNEAPGAKTDELVAEALSAALPSMAADATVVDWQGNVLKQGSGRYTCMPTAPELLEACATIARLYDALIATTGDPQLPGYQRCIVQVKAAIAKAESPGG